MTNKINLVYQVKGSAVEDGVDVFELSPLLLSIGQLIQESQEIVHPNSHCLGVNIKPFQKGSFIIELSVFARDNLQQLIDTINSEPIREIKEVLEWIGLIGGTSFGVVKIYKFLRGKPKRFEDVGPDEVKITKQDGNSITVNRGVFTLFQNNKIQQNLYNIYGNFLGKDGIDTVESYLSENKEQSVCVAKEDVPFFNPANTIPEEQDENEKRNITRVFLKPKRISLEGEADNWSLRKGEDVIITATIKDSEFLDKVKSGTIRLYKEDILEADLLEVQTVKENEVSVKYEVLKIVEYKKAPVQSSLLN